MLCLNIPHTRSNVKKYGTEYMCICYYNASFWDKIHEIAFYVLKVNLTNGKVNTYDWLLRVVSSSEYIGLLSYRIILCFAVRW